MNIFRIIGCTIIVAAMTACGGSSGSGTITVPPLDDDGTGGIIRGGIAVGSITNFGSVVVNGVRFDTDSATFTIDDAPGTQADLAVGDFVVVVGEYAADLVTGTATTVTYDDNVEGPIESIDQAGNTLVVLGQTVRTDATTSFGDGIGPGSIDGLTVGDIVEVTGFIDAAGVTIATRIELKPVGGEFEVRGVVANLDATAMTFSLAALTVDFSAATLDDDFPGGQISDGDFVEAKGDRLGGAGELVANRIELEDGPVSGSDGDRIEIEGLITRFASATDFDVSGVPVVTDSSTLFEGGVSADLGLNVKVEVEGDLDANGSIVASRVDIRRATVVRITADVDSVDTAGESLVMLDITVTVDSLTRLEDKSNADTDPLNLGDLNAGDYLEIRGTEFPVDSGDALARVIEREDPEAEAELQGFVTAVNEPEFSILGVSIQTDGSTIFHDENDDVISATDFFNAVTVNSLVKASGMESASNVVSAVQVEFEVEN